MNKYRSTSGRDCEDYALVDWWQDRLEVELQIILKELDRKIDKLKISDYTNETIKKDVNL